jgi:hypothetical protein
MSEMYKVKVYRREGRLWVGASVVGPVVHHAVDDLYPSDFTVEGLTRALILADQRAHEEMKILPWSERCRDNKGFWLVAGCKTWRKFMRGLTLCGIVREDEGTIVDYWVPDPKHPGGLSPTDFEEHHPPDISYEELAPIVLRVFASFPADMKVPIGKADPKPLP